MKFITTQKFDFVTFIQSVKAVNFINNLKTFVSK